MVEAVPDVKTALLEVIDELPPERVSEVLDFALFIRSRQDRYPSATEGPKENDYPLRGTVVRYDDPFGPVAESDWEAQSDCA